jgi:hypothetical protein
MRVRDTVDSVATVVGREYFDIDVAARVSAMLRQRETAGVYDTARTPEALASMLTRDLFEFTHDKHLAVMVVPQTTESNGTVPDTEGRAVRGRRENFGVVAADVLAGNVGYLHITTFYRVEEARDAIAAAMRLLERADALVIDLRDNVGGSPDTAALVAAYLFDSPDVPLFDIVSRDGEVTHYATPAAEPHNGTRPVYVLTSARSFSAGEGLAFLLQEQHRAIAVGERTAGAANPGRPYPAATGFDVVVPNGRVRAARSGGNWEGGGVVPDVAVTAADALTRAHELALRALIERTPNGPWRDRLSREAARLTTSPTTHAP